MLETRGKSSLSALPKSQLPKPAACARFGGGEGVHRHSCRAHLEARITRNEVVMSAVANAPGPGVRLSPQ